MSEPEQPLLIKHLQRAALYDHPVTGFHLLETHISYVLLTGSIAYKIKKPVNLGFVDFSTLAKRKFFCEEEVRLNRRSAPELYLGVVAITGSSRHPQLNGIGRVVEYAVMMRQFCEQDRLDHRLKKHRVSRAHIDQLARDVARLHDRAAVASIDSGYSTPASIRQRTLDNFAFIEPCTADGKRQQLEALYRWTVSTLGELDGTFADRLKRGRVRECHGDMHLANMVLVDNQVLLFDCLEFNPQFRWIDVASDVSFAMMDFHYHGRHDLAHRFWLRYLEHTGDYEALGILRHYLVYRALVRAKVTCIQSQQQDQMNVELKADTVRHILLAERLTHRFLKPPLIITYGLSGSGKTWLTENLVERTGFIRIRSDTERQRMAIAPQRLYTKKSVDEVYDRLRRLATRIIRDGYPVIVDATFLSLERRREFSDLAQQLSVPFRILHCSAPLSVLRKRVETRKHAKKDASEATVLVLDQQLEVQDPLTVEETAHAIEVDTASEPMWETILPALGMGSPKNPTR